MPRCSVGEMSEQVEVIVGVVARAHGVRGDLTIDVRTDEVARRFHPGAQLRTESGTRLAVTATRWHQGRLLARFDGYPDRTAAETLRGEVLVVDVPADESPSQPEEYFDRQLVGLRVLRADGTEAGHVVEVQHFPAQDLLVVDVDAEQRLVPFVAALVPTVDLAAGTLQLADVEGLLEDLE